MNWLIDETENEFIIKIKQLNLKKENFKLVRFSDYFEKIVIPSKLTYDKNKVMCSKDRRKYFHVPFYLATGNKHPDYYIHEQPSYVNTLNYKLVMLLFTGFCYEIDEHEFAINGHNSNTVLRCLNPDVNLMVTCLLLSRKFKTMFSWSKPAIFSRIKDENVFVYLNDTNVLSSEFKTVGVIPKLKIDKTKIHKIKFSDYFEKVKPRFNINNLNNLCKGPFPHFGARNQDKPDCYVNVYNYEDDNLIRLNKVGNSAGYCYVQNGNCAVNNNCLCYRLKNNELNLSITSLLLTNQFKKVYNYARPLNALILQTTECYVYFN